ncbi:hypothetical protein FOA43_003185 [Brettanomyces nanus]|uniref:Mitochondrial distribution and morphology protein 12 n=1 Tax=Eeniella nana TaxID=13502 RepID=A0A875S4I7_EENNA|nr:uncharacterized protein FOA43_003185 [Brettanomyces nanus]QPG75823.1 hypothetical protein FOA43_003185 [Brettanomyces nanus]
MSFEINWDTISTDESLRSALKDLLNERLSSINLPKYMDNLQVVEVDLGNVSPELAIRDIDHPFAEFYGQEDDNSADSSQGGSGGIHPTRVRSGKFNGTSFDAEGSAITAPHIPGISAPPISRSPSPSLVGYNPHLSSPIPRGSTAGLLIPRPSSPYFQGLHNGVGIGAFGMKENDTLSHNDTEAFAPVPMEPNLSIDGVQEDTPASTNTSVKPETLNNSDNSGLPRGKNDFQLTLDLQWTSKIYIEVTCNLVVNYPSPGFITLPVRLKISDLLIHSLAVCAYLDHRVFISFLCDLDDDESSSNREESRQDSRKSSIGDPTGGGFLNSDTFHSGSGDRIDMIKDLKIEGELGDYEDSSEGFDRSKTTSTSSNSTNLESPLKQSYYSSKPIRRERQSLQQLGTTMTTSDSGTVAETSGNGSVLRNIGKIEKFLVSALRKVLINELAWPSWIELDLREDEETSD